MEKYLNKDFLLSNKKTLIKAGIVLLLIIIAFFVFVLGENKKEQELSVAEQVAAAGAEGEETTVTKAIIFIDVGGAVKHPQVVELEEGCRVIDAISVAGGLTADADLSNINQAAFLTDGEKLYIPRIGEEPAEMPDLGGNSVGGNAAGGGPSSGKVNLNTASAEELQTLNGVGPVTAEKILDYRKTNGQFRSIEDLKNVSGIGEKTFEKMKDHIRI